MLPLTYHKTTPRSNQLDFGAGAGIEMLARVSLGAWNFSNAPVVKLRALPGFDFVHVMIRLGARHDTNRLLQEIGSCHSSRIALEVLADERLTGARPSQTGRDHA